LSRVIAIDLGSNTLRVLKWDCKKNKKLAEFEEIVRTAQELNSSGKISKEAIERIIRALNRAKEKIDFNDSKILAVATEALRRAKNQKEALQEIEEKTKIKFRVINGEEEAKLTLNAVSNRLRELGFGGSFVLVDIGGGSTEIIYKDAKRDISKSFPVGIVTVAKKYSNSLKEGIDKELKELKSWIEKNSFRVDFFVATAGTPTTIASIKLGMDYQTYEPQKINGTRLNIKDLDDALKLLLSLDEQKRAKLVGVGREDLIVAGVLIFRRLFEILGFEEAIVVDDGLREGLALSGCKERA